MEKITSDQRKLILQLPVPKQFDLHYSDMNGGGVWVHKLVDHADNDFDLLIAIGTVLAKEGKKVELLPKLHEKDVDFRRKVLPGVIQNKNPDLRINGEYWEVEAPKWPFKKASISNRLRKGQEQANAVILHFAKEINLRSIASLVIDKLKTHRGFKKAEIWVAGKREGIYIK